MAFRVGQKVACVDAKCSGRRLKKNAVYVVEDVLWTDSAGELGLLIARHPSSHPLAGWRASRFRPLVERSTDISVFKAMLTDTRQHESLGEG